MAAGQATFECARRGAPLGKSNATAQAVEGNLGGLCVRVVTQRNRRADFIEAAAYG